MTKTFDERIAVFMKTPIVSGMYEHPSAFELSDTLRFSKDWDWLMAVVGKIQGDYKYRLHVCLREFDNDGWGISASCIIFNEAPYYYYWKDYERIVDEIQKHKKEAARFGEVYEEKHRFIVESKFQAVFQSVCRFIEWWEKQDRKVVP